MDQERFRMNLWNKPLDYILEDQKHIQNEDIYKLTYTKADLKRKKVAKAFLKL